MITTNETNDLTGILGSVDFARLRKDKPYISDCGDQCGCDGHCPGDSDHCHDCACDFNCQCYDD